MAYVRAGNFWHPLLKNDLVFFIAVVPWLERGEEEIVHHRLLRPRTQNFSIKFIVIEVLDYWNGLSLGGTGRRCLLLFVGRPPTCMMSPCRHAAMLPNEPALSDSDTPPARMYIYQVTLARLF